ncbi:acyl-CoA dehydrogenase family protein [Pseudemcibacter aquimaris]|uniref:acyl-CoA dehydrogenase family protein n=1 Tax=Pseudemcibacter aquimaris TaxID=2857064 RepID=UPI0020126574|nr:acyl-CoA dehydrogenase family protein [Pseudemcibacter aquimaris]MCC3861563.1 acyl-CoA dehydrogenase family protein [Pseudemcibacter aquimaris]WDU58332.1 acyl-CoA dehydrogenase family protein [Pseudemcibacter aquimaris]
MNINVDQTYLDWPFLEDHHRTLAIDLEKWCQEHLNNIDHCDVDRACKDILSKLASGGWLQYVVPKEYGGIHENLDVRSLCLIRETLARHDGLADFVFAMQGLGSGTITLFGSDDIKREYLPAVASGKKMAAFALTEPESGSDVANMTTTAELNDDHYVINGAKTFISNGGIADYYVLFARTGDAPGAKGLSAIILDADASGLEITERIEVIAPHPLATLEFNNVKIPVSKSLGNSGDGFKAAMATLDIFRSTVGAAALGFARRALSDAVKRTNERHLFNAPLHNLQLVQGMLADSATDIDTSALLIYRAAWTKDTKPGRVTREAAMAKMHATETAQQVIDRAIQIFGGQGVVSGVKVEELYREIRALRIYEGATEVQKVVIARETLIQFEE